MEPRPDPRLRQHRAPPGLLDAALRRPAPPSRRGQGLAAAAIFALGVWVGHAPAPPPAAPELALAAPRAVPVRLVLHAPAAQTVAVAGTWNDWDPQATPLIAVGDGLFAVTIALPAGRHEYMFVVDGVHWVSDPAATLTQDDGFGRQNAVLNI